MLLIALTLVYVFSVNAVEVAIMNVIIMVIMLNSIMPTHISMLMVVMFVNLATLFNLVFLFCIFSFHRKILS